VKKATENIITTLKNKNVLFLENDNGLYHGLDQIEELLIKHKIEYKCLFEVSEIPFDKIVKEIQKCDVIVFQTQWVYKIAGQICEYMFSSKEKKIVIECYISDPTWFYKPKAVHDVYICKPPLRQWKDDEVNEDDWRFYKLSQKPYWDYKNNFNR
jgi:hypothetical protein